MRKSFLLIAAVSSVAFVSCKKKGCTDPTATNYSAEAEKDDGSCIEPTGPEYTVPSTYSFTDDSGNSTVSYSGQTDRLNQLAEMVVLMKSGTSNTLDAQVLKDMFANVNGDGNGNFSFSSTKQLKDKCFTADQALFETFMDEIATASIDHASTAADGQAGTLSSGTSTYLFDANGIEQVQVIEKGLMGAVFLNQALNVYFSSAKMDVDNSTAVDASAGKYYTAMEHHWDEAFGYFGVDTDFPTTIPSNFWGKYCNVQDATLNCNADMMDHFLRGRAAITADVITDRDAAITAIRTEWEEISAYQAMSYLDQAVANFGTDNAKFLHVLSEAYAFAWNLRYAPTETRRMSVAEHTALMAQFNTNFWSMTVSDINAIKATINAKY
ncbi:MAG: DUF4856 domain-containing protein [Flavobacteriales bacterium]|nr:DUF4856 domain-containing protein [Flavobacteriales bacterium]